MISPEQLQRIASTIGKQVLSEDAITRLRGEYPGIHFTYCMDDDLPNNKPMLESDGFNLYLVDSRDHCLCLTRNYAHASGIVIAEVTSE